jgi:stage II sporulation protein M
MANPLSRAALRRWLGGHLLGAVLVFVLGGVAGTLLATTLDPGALASFPGGSPFPEELTFLAILVNNLLAATVIALGVLTFGLVTALALLFNGLLLGLVLTFASAELGLATALALVVPHGVLELPALWIVGAVVFRVVHRGIRYLRRTDDALLTREEALEAAALLGVAALLIVVAAWIEANVTTAVAEAAT